MAPRDRTFMGSPKSEETQPEQHVSGVASSSDVRGVRDVRVERETTPAPSGTTDEWASFPSERPTSVPTYYVAAVAFETSLRHQALPGLPLDVAIPTRTSVPAPADLELRASFLLLHVDGHSSVRDIADLTSIPVGEVLVMFLALTARGLVELGGTQAVAAVPTSGERSKSEG